VGHGEPFCHDPPRVRRFYSDASHPRLSVIALWVKVIGDIYLNGLLLDKDRTEWVEVGDGTWTYGGGYDPGHITGQDIKDAIGIAEGSFAQNCQDDDNHTGDTGR
jgi:hypothetical protein